MRSDSTNVTACSLRADTVERVDRLGHLINTACDGIMLSERTFLDADAPAALAA
jgi:hypothetical protein